MSLYRDFTLAAALGLQVDCRHDAGGDGGAGGGSPDVGAAGGADASLDDSAQATEPDVHVDASAAQAAADDDDDEPDFKDDAHRDKPWANDPDFKRALNRARRAQRQAAKYRPIVEKVRAFGVEGNLEDVVRRAQRYNEVEPQLRRGAPGGDSSRADRQTPQEYQPPPFDRNTVPFDPNDQAGRWMIDYAEQQHNAYHKVVGVVHAMAREINALREGHQGEQRTKEVNTWRGEITTASKQIPEKWNGMPLRQLFEDAVIGAFHQARVTGRRINPQAVIAHYMKEYKPQRSNQAAVSAAAQQRMAENNRALPGRTAFAGGSPTQARNRSQERVSDVSKRLLGGRRW